MLDTENQPETNHPLKMKGVCVREALLKNKCFLSGIAQTQKDRGQIQEDTQGSSSNQIETNTQKSKSEIEDD